MFHGMGINLDKPCTIIILQCSGMYLFVIDNLKVLITDYVYILKIIIMQLIVLIQLENMLSF